MKTLVSHINKALKIGKNLSSFSTYSCQPTTSYELEQIIKDRISKDGPNCDLNDIDVSQITDMSWLFYESDFNGDISKWDVSNVKNMDAMFHFSKFNGDISNWNVSNVKNMHLMFAHSTFNQDISNWNVNNVTDAYAMFAYSKISKDISKWKINKDCIVDDMFRDCPIKSEYKPVLPK